MTSILKTMKVYVTDYRSSVVDPLLGFIDRPFVEFLKSQDLTDNLIHFIIHSIAMVTIDTRTTDVSHISKEVMVTVAIF